MRKIHTRRKPVQDAPPLVFVPLPERIANYKVPRKVLFQAVLPREDTGKIFKRRLRDPYWAGRTRRV